MGPGQMGPAQRSQFAAPCKGTPHIHLWATHWPVICMACAAAPRLWAHGLGCPHNCYMHLTKMVWVLRSTIHGLGQPLDAAAALRALHNSSNTTAPSHSTISHQSHSTVMCRSRKIAAPSCTDLATPFRTDLAAPSRTDLAAKNVACNDNSCKWCFLAPTNMALQTTLVC